jgi:hypothetical protein
MSASHLQPTAASMLRLFVFTVVVCSSLSLRAPESKASPLSASDEALIRDLETKSWDAWKAQDAAFFEGFLSPDHIEVHGYGVVDKAAVVAGVRSARCSVSSFSLGPMSLVALSPDTVAVTYRAEQDTKCGAAKVPSPVWATSVYVKRSGKWLNALYQQTPVQ